VLKKIFGSKRNETLRGWRNLHNEELYNLYFSPNKIGMINSKRIKWAEHVASHEEKKNEYKVLMGKPEEKGALRRPRLGGRIILRWILEKWDGVVWTELIRFKRDITGGLL
jgi:hypothetical protein